jgi:hypothetical protein
MPVVVVAEQMQVQVVRVALAGAVQGQMVTAMERRLPRIQVVAGAVLEA